MFKACMTLPALKSEAAVRPVNLSEIEEQRRLVGNSGVSWDTGTSQHLISFLFLRTIWLWVYYDKIRRYTIFYLLKGDSIHIYIYTHTQQCTFILVMGFLKKQTPSLDWRR